MNEEDNLSQLQRFALPAMHYGNQCASLCLKG
jgi:hypothetical protein